MSFLAFLPGIIAIIVLCFKGEGSAFRNVYLPVLILIPQVFYSEIAGMPSFSTASAAILPIALFSAVKYIRNWSWTLMDLWVLVFILTCYGSEYYNTGNIEGKKNLSLILLIDMALKVAFPYLLAKALIHRKGKSTEYAKQIVILLVIAVIISLFEMRFVTNPFVAVFKPFFPGQGEDWPTLYRYGLVRIGGPFVQTILFGIALSVGFILNYWLTRTGQWGKAHRTIPKTIFHRWIKSLNFLFSFAWLVPRSKYKDMNVETSAIPISKGWFFACVILVGLLMTVSRGPLVGVSSGFLFATAGYSRRHTWALGWRIIAFAIAIVLGYAVYRYYAEVSATLSPDMTATAAYRAKLFERYYQAIEEKPFFGWGYTTWPHDSALQSVDNEYLFLILKHGLVSFASFLFVIFWICIRLAKQGIRFNDELRVEESLCYTLLGCIVAIAVSVITVFLGLQLQPLFFLLIGWAEGFLVVNRPKRRLRVRF